MTEEEQIKARVQTAVGEVKSIAHAADSEGRSLTRQEKARIDELITEAKRLKGELNLKRKVTSPKGMLLDPNNFRNNVWVNVVAEAGVNPRFRFHDLRHTCGSLLASGGVPLHEVKEHLGHCSVMVTEKYVHFYPKGSKAVATSLFDYLAKDVFAARLDQRTWSEVGLIADPAISQSPENGALAGLL